MRRPAARTAGVLTASAALLVTTVVAPSLDPDLLGDSAAGAEQRVVTLVGSLQDELGCEADWQPACTRTELDRVGDSSAYSGRFEVPEGTWELKVAINRSWDESYGTPTGENVPLVLQGPAELEFTYDDATHEIGFGPTELSGPATGGRGPRRGQPARAAHRRAVYFVMADRFANGDPANDTGGIEGDRLDHGFDPTDKGFYHGGDLAGILDRLDYIEGLGTTAIWLTPSFKNRLVQGTGADASAGYHGYWITDFTQIDPHLGTNAEMEALIDAAHDRGMKVFFDITNWRCT